MVVSVFLLDDHELVRRGICQLLDTEADITVVGEAADTASVSAGRCGPRSSRHRRA
jgi:DNA-binding NarL/FixJ family response regulator